MQFVDEWIVGYRRSLPGQMALDASFVRRNWKDRPANIEINGIYDDGVFRGYRNEDFNAFYRITNNTWNSLVYSGLEFTVTRRTRKVQLIAGYTRAWDHIDGTWQPNDPASFIQPEAFANDRGIGSFRGGVSDANSYTNTWNTRNSGWQDHQFRIGATWEAPYGFLLARNYSLMSGPYSGPIIDQIAEPDPGFGPTHGHALERPRRPESARDAAPFRLRDPGRGADQAAGAAGAEPASRSCVRYRADAAGRVDRRLQRSRTTDAFQEFFAGQSNVRLQPFYIIGPDGEHPGQQSAVRACVPGPREV